MLKVLIVEDNTEKLAKVVKGISSLDCCPLECIDEVRDAGNAKRKLKERKYDLLILDIALPAQIDSDPEPNGGISLLNEIVERDDVYHLPDHIVGLTAFESSKALAQADFDKELWSLIHFDATSEEWEQQLKGKIEHISAVRAQGNGEDEFNYDLAVVTALNDPELKAVLDLDWKWKPVDIRNDHTIYHEGEFKTASGVKKVVAASARAMGMPAAAALSMKMIGLFRPRFMAMTGILAGTQGDTNLGDIIVASQCWDWGSGKHYKKEGGAFFASDPTQVTLDTDIQGIVDRVEDNVTRLNEIRENWKGSKPESVLRLHQGPVASGASVIANGDIYAEIQDQHRKLLGIEMEAYGVLAAAKLASNPKPKAFIAKSVCDFADEQKNDNYQQYASYTSAQALQEIAVKLFA